MGTAGPLRLASDILDDGSGDPFFVLNRHAAEAVMLCSHLTGALLQQQATPLLT